MELNVDMANHWMQTRKSVFPKDYSGAAVPRHMIEQMLQNAHRAPTHKLTEPWRFVVFTGEGLKALARFQAECYRTVTEVNQTFDADKYQALLTKPLLSSHIIAIGMKRDEAQRVPEVEEIGAVFCAVQNMYLTATAYGIGCYLSTGGITYFTEAKSFFKLGPNDRLLGFLHVGMIRGEGPSPTRRKPLEEKVRWVE